MSPKFEPGKNIAMKVPVHEYENEVWLELVTSDCDDAARYLEDKGCVRRDEIEDLPHGFRGLWVSSPSNIIHLVTESDDG